MAKGERLGALQMGAFEEMARAAMGAITSQRVVLTSAPASAEAAREEGRYKPYRADCGRHRSTLPLIRHDAPLWSAETPIVSFTSLCDCDLGNSAAIFAGVIGSGGS